MREVYVMGSTRYWFRYKIGISHNAKKRSEWISKSIKGDAYVIFKLPFFYAEHVETIMHQIYRPLNAKMSGSGKTEWFWLVLPVTPILLLISIWLLQWFAVLLIPLLVIQFYNYGYEKKERDRIKFDRNSSSRGNSSLDSLRKTAPKHPRKDSNALLSPIRYPKI